jgi:hypothetical protein
MDSRLDRYLSYEYLVSPCPKPSFGNSAQTESLAEVRNALERVQEALDRLRSACAIDERMASACAELESELTRASSLLQAAQNDIWLA